MFAKQESEPLKLLNPGEPTHALRIAFKLQQPSKVLGRHRFCHHDKSHSHSPCYVRFSKAIQMY